ncbi:MAG: type III pantothenate kinase [Phycisphaerae bacterium]|nr:type III pantothenate kinase [Phycisphaerae bacterium]NUQ45990.1 type III pantothenate kinase [Phycisphaerae bacterium]
MLHDPRSAAGLLLVEIGNSHVTLAAAPRDRVEQPRRFERDTVDDFGPSALSVWNDFPAGRRREIVIASVVPDDTVRFRNELHDRLGAEPLVLGEHIPVSIHTNLAAPERIGIDRLCGAAAAYAEVQAACVVAGFGTATTIDCVSNEGVFVGGAILPGLALQAWSLRQRTAQLPEITIETPEHVYGRNTLEAINNGIVYGAAGALREIVERYATDLGRWPRLVLTGGFAPLMRDICDFVDALVPDLVLRGMALSYRRFYASEPPADSGEGFRSVTLN